MNYGKRLSPLQHTLCVAMLIALCVLPTSNSRADNNIVFASYNLENFLTMERMEDGQKVNAPKPEKEIHAVIGVIIQIHPDILGMMEMGDKNTLNDFQNRLKKVGLDYPYCEWLQGADPQRHIALLSRFPIVSRNSVADIPFNINGKPEHMLRGILDVSIQVTPTYLLRLVGAHLKSHLPTPFYDEAWVRAKEAWYLREHIDKILAQHSEENLLVFGDFNDTKNEYPIRELIGESGSPNYMMDLWLKDDHGEHWTQYWKYADIYSRIDYILVNRALATHVNKKQSGISSAPFWNEASDHRAIFATIQVN